MQRDFCSKINWDRHIKRIHPNAEPNLSQLDSIDTELPVPTLDSDMAETMNVSVLERSVRMVDEETPIF